jgi:hypothetical protein
MLPAGHSSNEDLFVGTMLPGIVDDRVLGHPKPKASELFSVLAMHDLSPLPTNMTNLGLKDYLILSTVQNWFSVIFGYSDIVSIGCPAQV